MTLSKAFEAARKHARKDYPAESCGVIENGIYHPYPNLAEPASAHVENTPCSCVLCTFVMKHALRDHPNAQTIVHSHPGGPLFPSKSDAASQMATALPWAIIPLDEERVGEPVIWGGDTPVAPILGREFCHFVADCYTLIRDVYRLGAEKLKKQDIDWPFAPIDLPDYPRDDAWWINDADDFYNVEPAKIGFTEIDRREARAGDVFLTSINSTKLNHGGVLLDNELILHHLPMRLSRREPAGLWGRNVKRWLRYTGAGA